MKRLTRLERLIYMRFTTSRAGMVQIGRENNMSDSEARAVFDTALDKLRKKD